MYSTVRRANRSILSRSARSASTVPGETALPTQPYVPLPKSVSRRQMARRLWLADIAASATAAECGRTERRRPFHAAQLEGSLVYPGTIGGIEWGGGAVDPNTDFRRQLLERGADLQIDPA